MPQDHQNGLHGGRLFALAWLGVYPMVTLVSWLTGDVLLTLPLPIRTLVLSGLMVGYMVFFWIPFIQRFHPARERAGGTVSIEP
jgi:antibiotic biosynthesis monooxygenase (ABM) superfamily enzyme